MSTTSEVKSWNINKVDKYYKQPQAMFNLRSFQKIINMNHFTKPNSYIYQASHSPSYLCTSTDPSPDHATTLKSLHRTLQQLKNYEQTGQLKSLVQKEVKYLEKHAENYEMCVKKFVENGGRVTAQGLANLYACAEELAIDGAWLQKYALDEVPHQIQNMNIDNLNDLIVGMEKFHTDSKYIELVKNELATRNQDPYQYVDRVGNEGILFTEKSPSPSNHLLISALQQGGALKYYWSQAWSLSTGLYYSFVWKRPARYALHD